MVNTNRLRLVVSALAIAFLGTACDNVNAGAPQTGDECYVTPDYQISCPTPNPDLGIKVD